METGLGKTATEFLEKYFGTLVMLVNHMPEKEFRKTLKKIYELTSPECKESFKEFYHSPKADTDRKVLGRLNKSVMLYKKRDL
jgi:hypothetical protein